MPSTMPVSMTVPAGGGYGMDYAAIERQRRLAEALQEQANQQLPVNQTAGGWVVPISPTQGLAKIAQALSGRYQVSQADKKERDLAARAQQDLSTALTSYDRDRQNQPEIAQPSADLGGGPGRPAIAGDERSSILSNLINSPHPLAQQMGMQRLQTVQANQDRQQKLKDALKLASGAGVSGIDEAGAGGVAGGIAGLPSHVVALMTSGDPELVALGKEWMSANRGIAQRPGAPVVNPMTGRVIAQPPPNVPPGVGLTAGPTGYSAAPVPGAQQAMGALASSQAGATEAGKAPYQLQTVNTEGAPTLMTHQQAIEAATGAPMPRPGAPLTLGPPLAPETARAGFNELQANAPAQAAAGDSLLRREALAGAQDLGVRAPPAKPAVPGLKLQDQGESAQQKKFGEEKAILQANAPQARAAVADATTNLQRMESLARGIMNDANLGRVTGLMGAMPNIPGSKASDIDAQLNSLKSQVGFAVLQAMRDASKTGGALGQISDRENELLQRNLTALDKSQSVAGMKNSLKVLVDYAAGAVQRLQRGYSDTYERVIGNQGMQPTAQGAVPAGGLTPAEQSELEQLRARFGRK